MTTIRFYLSAFACMLAGSQLVHLYFQPLAVSPSPLEPVFAC